MGTLSAARRKSVVSEFRTHAKDSGSPEVQVALLTERIRELTEHLKDHDHDYASRRGLNRMVSKRTRLTNYLRETDRNRYLELVKRLGLRK
jgi:small subunit ribosomal protein S15